MCVDTAVGPKVAIIVGRFRIKEENITLFCRMSGGTAVLWLSLVWFILIHILVTIRHLCSIISFANALRLNLPFCAYILKSISES